VSSPQNTEYTAVRKLAGVLCFVVGLVIALLDAVSADFEVNWIVLLIIFGFGAALFGVPLPDFNINVPFVGKKEDK
jgi:hypothetical protein